MIFTSFIGTNYSKKAYRNKKNFSCGSTVKPIQNRGHKRYFGITGTESSLALHDWLVPSTITAPQNQTDKSYKTIKFQFKFTNP